MNPAVRIREVGPRDGIQSEKAAISTEDKIRFVDMLSASGLRFIEVTSFVSPKAVPQMSDAAELFSSINRSDGVFYSALVPNKRGAEAAIAARADGLQVFIAATDSYNLKNVGKTVADSLPDVEEVADVARAAGLPVEGTISCAFGDPYEGDVAPERVAEIAASLFGMGIEGISFGDTTGMGTPRRVREVVGAVREALPELDINLHLHDTRGTGLANALAGLEMGIDYFDGSVGGMGGSPFASGSTGNICTEDLVHMFEDMGVETGIDLEALLEASRFVQSLVEGELPSKLLKAGPRWAVTT